MEKDSSAETKIRIAAKKIFVAKGFEACSSREIAREAGTNVALVNYYFKSKNQLFEVIILEVMKEFSLSLMQVFKSDLSLINKTRIFIEKEYEFLSKHPEIPKFIINELGRKDKCFFDQLNFKQEMLEANVFQQIQEAQSKGEMRKIDVFSIFMLLISNCQYPFLAKPMMQLIHSVNEEQFEQQLMIHKQYVTEMLINYIFPSKN